MKLITLNVEDFSGDMIRKSVEEFDIVIVKNLIKPQLLSTLRSQLTSWKTNVPGEDPKNHYPENKRNLHIMAYNKQDNSDSSDIDYYEDHTNIDVYNFRIGDMYDPDFREQVPCFKEIGEQLLKKYSDVIQVPFIQHGQGTDENLYFEIAHYHNDGAYIEKHIHQRNMDLGQRINMVTMMSQSTRDFDESGLFFEHSNTTIDTTDELSEGDSVFFRMDIPHWVTPVRAPKESQNRTGRWTITTFYY